MQEAASCMATLCTMQELLGQAKYINADMMLLACLHLQLVSELPLEPSSDHLEALQALCGRLSDNITDTTINKDVSIVQQLLQQLARDSGHEQQQLQPGQLEQLIANLEALSLQLPPIPEAVAAASSGTAATPAPRTARKTTAARKASKGAATAGRTGTKGTAKKRAAVSSSDDNSSSSSEEEASEGDSSDNSNDDQEEESVAASAVDLVGAAAALAVSTGKASAVGPVRRSSARQPLGPSSVVNT